MSTPPGPRAAAQTESELLGALFSPAGVEVIGQMEGMRPPSTRMMLPVM